MGLLAAARAVGPVAGGVDVVVLEALEDHVVEVDAEDRLGTDPAEARGAGWQVSTRSVNGLGPGGQVWVTTWAPVQKVCT